MRNVRTGLKEARMKRGLTQSAVAGRAGIPQQQVSAIETGSVDPRLSTVEAVASALGLEVSLDDAE